jgi:hypothetical protein
MQDLDQKISNRPSKIEIQETRYKQAPSDPVSKLTFSKTNISREINNYESS